MNQRHRDITAASRSHVGRGVGEGQRRNGILREPGEHQRWAYAQGVAGPGVWRVAGTEVKEGVNTVS